MSEQGVPGPRRAEKKAASRRRILEAARAVFFRDGFMAANLDEVATRAGVAKGTLYRYFDSKAELYVTVLVDDGQVVARRLEETITGEHAPPEQLRRTGRFYLEHWMKFPEYFQIFWALENQPVIGELPEDLLDEVTRLWETCVQIVASIIEEGVRTGDFRDCDPSEVSHLLWTFANSIIQTEANPARRRLRRRSLEQAYDEAFEIVLKGLKTRSPTDAG